MKKILFLSLLAFGLVNSNLHAQNQKEESKNTPKQGSWQVHKEYDENGRLIAMDSTYSYHSFNGKNVSPEEFEDLMKDFKAELREGFDMDELFNQFDFSQFDDLFKGLGTSPEALFQQFNDGAFEDLFSAFNSEEFSKLLEEFDFEKLEKMDFSPFFGEDHEEFNQLIQEEMEKFQQSQGSSKSENSIPKTEKNSQKSNTSQQAEGEKYYKI